MPPPGAPPARPPWREERLASALLRGLAPRLPRIPPPSPPDSLAPWEPLEIPRRERGGALQATLYPVHESARGVVLFLPPWMEWGQTYFHRRGRLEAVRRAGFHALTVDLSGFGGSSPPRGFFDRDVEDALAALADGFPGLPVVLWGVSSGGYWAHPVLARQADVAAAVFEDVSAHLLEWSWRETPLLRLAIAAQRLLLPRAHRYLDLRRHAPYLLVRRVAYVSGELDRGVRPEDTRELARLAGGEALVVPEAGHLGAIKRAPEQVLAVALRILAGEEPATSP